MSRQHFWFVQDDFRIKPKLTMNLGFRWGFYTPTVEKHGRQSTFDPLVPNPGADGLLGALVFADNNGLGGCTGSGGSSLCRHQIARTHYNYEPRLGMAYRLNDKTVFRLGYGITSFAGGAVLDMGPIQGTAFVDGFIASETLQSLNNGVTPAFNWDTPGQPPPSTPPVHSLTYDNNSSIAYMGRENARVPYMQNWSAQRPTRIAGPCCP